MKSALIILGALTLLLGVFRVALANQSTSTAQSCEGFDGYAQAVLEAQEAFWTSVRRDGLVDSDPAEFTEDEWLAVAQFAEEAQAAFKQIEPPIGVANWHRFQIMELGFQGLFGRLVAMNTFAAAQQSLSGALELLDIDRIEQRDRALAACPEFAEFYERFVILSFSELADTFFQQLILGFEERGFSLDPGARALLADLAQRAAGQAAAGPDSQTALHSFAEGSVSFSDVVIEEATLQGENVIHEEGIRDALRDLCPLLHFW